MNPNGLVAAASITSQVSRPSRPHMMATSLTRPMFTARKVFSSSFTISAVSVDETGMTLSMNLPYRATACSRLSGLAPPITLGVFLVKNFVLPGSTRSGRERQEEVPIQLQAGALQLGQQHLAGEAGEGRALQDHQLLGAHALDHQIGGVQDERVVRILGLVQRGGDADDQGVGLAQHLGVDRRRQPLAPSPAAPRSRWGRRRCRTCRR